LLEDLELFAFSQKNHKVISPREQDDLKIIQKSEALKWRDFALELS